MEQSKIDKINELARKARTFELTEEEKELQKSLREEYILEFRASLLCVLDNTMIQRPDGTLEKLRQKE